MTPGLIDAAKDTRQRRSSGMAESPRRYKKPSNTRTAQGDLLQQIAAECQVVVIAVQNRATEKLHRFADELFEEVPGALRGGRPIPRLSRAWRAGLLSSGECRDDPPPFEPGPQRDNAPQPVRATRRQ